MDTLKVLKSIDFGDSVAELEAERLENYFVETHQWQNIKNGDVDIVYGPKGSGKSAIYSLIDSKESKFSKENIILRFAENPQGTTVFSDLKTGHPPSEREFVYLWKLYLLILIGHHFEDIGAWGSDGKDVVKALKDSGFILESNPLKALLGSAMKYLQRYIYIESIEPNVSFDIADATVKGVGMKISFTEPSTKSANDGIQSVDTLLHKANNDLEDSGFKIWFLLDRLDVAFADSRNLEENALRALFKTYLDFAGYGSIHLKIFLRSDIWKSITRGGFREATHIRRSTTIDWDRDGILNLIMRRFADNEVIQRRYNIDVDSLRNSQDEQEKIFYELFPKQVDTGKNPETLEWLIARVEDSAEYSAPRDIINLINAALKEQIKVLELGGDEPEGQRLFSRSALKEGLNVASREKVEKYLFAEYPSLRSYFDKLRGEKTSQTNSTLARLWSVSEKKAEVVAKQIAETGVWKERGSDPVRYWTMFIFRSGLDMVQGKAR